MANSFVSADTLGLIGKEAAYEWKNNNSFLNAAVRDYDNMYADNVVYNPGDTIQVRLPNNFLTQEGNTVTAKDIKEATASVVLEDLLSVPLTYTTTDLTTKVGLSNFMARVVRPAARSLTNVLNAKIALKAATQVSAYVGDATADLSAYSNIDDAAVKLDEMACSRAQMRYCALSPKQAGKLRSASSIQNSFLPSLNEEVTRNAQLGHLAGFDMMMDQAINYHTSGGAHVGATVKTTVTSGATSIVMTGLTVSTTGIIKAGDVFQLTGIYSVNPITLESTGNPMQFVATADADSDGSGDATVSISPAIISDTTNARRNVSGTVVATTAITFTASHRVNLAWAQDGLIIVAPKLAPLDTPSSIVMQDPDTGFSLRLSKSAEILDNANILRLDVLYGIRWLNDRCVRVLTK